MSYVYAIDLGGVLVHDPFHELFENLHRSGGVPATVLQEWYEENLRYPLWSGTIPEENFWSEMLRESGADGSSEQWREELLASLRFLPAAARIRDLQAEGPLYSVSNHRHEWIRPLLEESGLQNYFEEILLSSEIGEVKPDPAFWDILLDRSGAAPEEIIVVDNLERNLLSARNRGMGTILADPDGDWIDEILL